MASGARASNLHPNHCRASDSSRKRARAALYAVNEVIRHGDEGKSERLFDIMWQDEVKFRICCSQSNRITQSSAIDFYKCVQAYGMEPRSRIWYWS